MSNLAMTLAHGFHEYRLAGQYRPVYTTREDTEFTYTFKNYFHPFVGELIQQLNRKSVDGLFDATFLASLETPFFKDFYTAGTDLVKFGDDPTKNIDLSIGGPYANYNWELLFHVPLTIAVHLSKNQRFAEAQRWFHYIFDPTCNDISLPPLKRFWRFLAFRSQANPPLQIDQLLELLSQDPSTLSDAALNTRKEIEAGYATILRNPFKPHAVAESRQVAYQYYVVMKYLDNLIAWGDALFRQDTIETLNEATQRYVLAANILGQRPREIPLRGLVRPKNYADLRSGLDKMGNAFVELEAKFPFNVGLPQSSGASTDASAPLFGIGRSLYFCVPRNEKMLSYWDTVGDRLFKLRHCMNIEGVVRQLALFDPPIDPGMLVKAAAAGIDIGSTLSGLNQPLGPMRALFLIQKSLELCAEVKGLGGALLAAIEKGDAERMAVLRQNHEIRIQTAAQEVRFLQWKQAEESTESLLRTRATALERFHYYRRQLGIPPNETQAPDSFPLSRQPLNEDNFDEVYGALVEQYNRAIDIGAFPELNASGEDSPSLVSGVLGAGKLYLSAHEDKELNELGPLATGLRVAAGALNTTASVLTFIPDIQAQLAFWGLGAAPTVFGGAKLADSLKITAEMLSIQATLAQDSASSMAKVASYERRADDWMLQSNLAARELMQIGRQLISSLIAEQIAKHEYQNIKKQIAQSQEVADLMRDKFSNADLYLWMQGEISRLYYEYYRFAFDTARKAEQVAKRELMRPEVDAASYIAFNYWDGGRKGLLSGEALYLDVKRLEMAYHENNKREYELTRHVSLRQLNPAALLALRATGQCEVSLPEWLFDMDAPGHYMRRIRSVGLSLPAVTGPYTSVSCTLSLLKSSLRVLPNLESGYARQVDIDDPRFVDYFGTIQSIVTSSGNNDTGLFEGTPRDERLLPFEGMGVESTWRLELPASFRQFDYDSISDVIFHVRYTARQGGAQLGGEAVKNLGEIVAGPQAAGFALLLAPRSDFAGEWNQFLNGAGNLELTLRREHFPYLAQRASSLTLGEVRFLAPTADGKMKSLRPQLDYEALGKDLATNGAFKLSVPPDNDTLKRDKAAKVFIVLTYSL